MVILAAAGRRGTLVQMAEISIVDPHVHFWLPSARPWYPLMQEPDPARPSTLGDLRRMAHDYTAADYRVDSAGFDVTALVHVSATSRRGAHLRELDWLDGMARGEGRPAAAIGTIESDADWARIESELDTQRRSPLFRGIRVLRGLDPSTATTAALLDHLEKHALIFDLVAHPHSMSRWAETLRAHENLTVVLEHAGWPISAADFDDWSWGLARLGALPNVHCKISGLGMTVHTLDATVQRPWVQRCLEVFGPRRAMFASNFPVDRMYGEFGRLYDGYFTAAEQYDPTDQEALFATNARRIYRPDASRP